MELPSLGKHCAEQSCKQLDFLPMKCDACSNIFCKDHFRYNSHSCSEAYKKNNQIPACPLCRKPIPVRPGSIADDEVGRHIDSECQSDPAKERRGKVYSNRCNKKGCKGKEIIPMTCDKCLNNFCIRHRHQLDHNCQGFESSGRPGSKAGEAAINRLARMTKEEKQQGTLQQTKITSYGKLSNQGKQAAKRQMPIGGLLGQFQGTMSEEEALAQAIACSMASCVSSEGPSLTPDEVWLRQKQEEEDSVLAHAIAQADEEKMRSSRRQTVKVSS